MYGHGISETFAEGLAMDKGYIENGFIVDVSNAQKTAEIIYAEFWTCRMLKVKMSA